MTLTADEALARKGASGAHAGDAEAVEYVREKESDGVAVLSTDLFAEAKEDGFTVSDTRRAPRATKAKGAPTEFQGPWRWSLPGSAPP